MQRTADLPAAVVVVDPLSTGALVAADACKRGFAVIYVWTAPEALRQKVALGAGTTPVKSLMHVGGVEEAAITPTREALRALPFAIVGVIVGSEPAVLVADALAAEMGLRGNGMRLAHIWSSKFEQSEAVRRAGLRAVRQILVSSTEDALAFAASLPREPFRAIVKPSNSAASEDVELCTTMQQVDSHVRRTLGKRNVLGRRNKMLVQEFLVGVEYAVDCVSRDGVHKCVAVWRYDKRALHGGKFVYFGTWPVEPSSAAATSLIPYVFDVLDALALKNGATHTEVILSELGEPCLVECNCRSHGANGDWADLATHLYGYNQVDVLVDAFVDPAAFESRPTIPPQQRYAGMLAFLPCYKRGICVDVPMFKLLAQLPSHFSSALSITPGRHVRPTVDALTDIGVVKLAHADPSVVQADYAKLHEMCADDGFLAIAPDVLPD